MWNQLEYRALEGFVYAVTPFNFTSIAANLPTAPALMGNTVVWKPASSAMFSAHYLMQLLEEAGLPPGVINFVPGDAAMISNVLLSHRDLAGVHFTGSTDGLPADVEDDRRVDRQLPLVSAHRRRNRRQGFHRRASVGGSGRARRGDRARRLRVPGPEVLGGQPRLHPAVDVERRARSRRRDDRRDPDGRRARLPQLHGRRHRQARVRQDHAATSTHARSTREDRRRRRRADAQPGYFIRPTLIETSDPAYRTLCEEIFGPVVTAYVYDDAKWEETLELVDATSPYALTGAVFAQDRRAILEATSALRYAAGNFYINDKPTGAVVGQQPFGGARASGTNDKAGSKLNLVRWVSARTVKENFNPPRDYRYPFMAAE